MLKDYLGDENLLTKKFFARYSNFEEVILDYLLNSNRDINKFNWSHSNLIIKQKFNKWWIFIQNKQKKTPKIIGKK